jgi:ubiquinone/menaquinone biosynthesis C-methylase UbiE
VAEQPKWDAGLHDDKHSFVWKLAAGVLEWLDAQPGERILDLGCGTGHLTAKIAEIGAHVVGVDRSPEMIRQARGKYPSLRFEVMDAREISLDETFDAVFSNATLHWIKEPERVLAGIRKVLRPGGRFVAEFGGKGNTGKLVKAVQQTWVKLGIPGPAPHPWYYPTIGEYAGLLEQHGFEVTHTTLFDRPTPLDDGERGLRNWLEMFGSAFVGDLPEATRESLLVEIERELRITLFHADHWVMDYRRLRVLAKCPD